MSSTALPKSKAKTAYGLLSEIAALTKAEPKRMRMSSWGGRKGNATGLGSMRPACNTVGCIGGWVNVLSKHNDHAETVLGITFEQQHELFFGPLCDAENVGTATHARKVIALIRRFQKKYTKQLKAKRV